MISVKFNGRTEKLRTDFQNWLKSNPPPVVSSRVSLDEFVSSSRKWQNTLAKDRWVAVHWPERCGGRGLTLLDEAVVQECLAQARSPQLVNLFGITMVGPVLIEHGTSGQQERFLPKILTAEEIWCQGFSEPEAGSDLAALKTVGVLDGKNWKVSGQKIWTSFAQFAQWCFLLVRTDLQAPKHKGLSYLLVPMNTAGITVLPLTQISGDKEFNELFLDQVQIPTEYMLGKPGDGWKIAITTLMYERIVLTFARHLQSEQALLEIKEVLKAPSESQLVELGRLLAKNMALRALALSHLSQYDKRSPGPEGSLDKLAWSETFQEICKFALSIQGLPGLISSGPGAYLDGAFPHRYLYSRGRTIAAGTSEIQRNIIAERVLGLPRSE